MKSSASFTLGIAVGMLLMLGADSLHWFITPAAHPDASSVRSLGVAIQAVVAFGGAAALILYHRRRVRPSDAA